jgi:hypothetical protein
MSGMLGFVANKTASAQQHPQKGPRDRQTVAARSKVRVPVKQTNVTKNQHATTMQSPVNLTECFAPTELGTSARSYVQVEDSQINSQGLPFGHFDQWDEAQGYHGSSQRPQNDDIVEEGFLGSEEYGDSEDDGDDLGLHPPQQGAGNIHIPEAIQHALREQGDPFASSQTYRTTTSGGSDDEEDDEHASQQGYQDEHALPLDIQNLSPNQDQRNIGGRKFTQLRQHQQLAPRTDNRALFHAGDIARQFRNQPMALRQSPPIGFGIQQGHQRLPSQGIHGTASTPQESQQAFRPKTTSSSQRVYSPNTLQVDDEGESLDYDFATIKVLKFADLNSQSFDIDPSSAGSAMKRKVDLTEDECRQPLPKRLALVRDKEVTSQQAFFATLSIDEWEEAGDWFLGQFGELINKMRDERKEKRKLARDFEEEVYQRHKRVEKRKHKITDELGNMRSSGREVLRGGTPKHLKTVATVGASN